MISKCNNSCTNAPQWYDIRTLPVLSSMHSEARMRPTESLPQWVRGWRNKNQPDALSFLVYFNNYPLHVPNRLTIRHREAIYCICSLWHLSCWKYIKIVQNYIYIYIVIKNLKHYIVCKVPNYIKTFFVDKRFFHRSTKLTTFIDLAPMLRTHRSIPPVIHTATRFQAVLSTGTALHLHASR